MPGHTLKADDGAQLATLDPLPAHVHDEKLLSSNGDVDVVNEKEGYYSDGKESQLESSTAEDSSVEWVNGEPVISNGRDVSKYLIDVRDDGDPAITFRSLVLGTVFAGLGATLVQVCIVGLWSPK